MVSGQRSARARGNGEAAALLTEVDTVTSGGHDKGFKVGVGDRWEQWPGGVKLSGIGAKRGDETVGLA